MIISRATTLQPLFSFTSRVARRTFALHVRSGLSSHRWPAPRENEPVPPLCEPPCLPVRQAKSGAS